MPARLLGVLFLLGLPLLAANPDASKLSLDRWPAWRGPGGQGHALDDRVPLTWSESENVLWKTRMSGRGNSTPIVWDDRIFLTSASEKGNVRTVLCVRASDGKLLWQDDVARNVPSERSHAWNGYASPSCVTDGQYVWSFFGTPGLFCHTVEGKLVWKKTFGTFTSAAGWGTGASPFLHGDLIILNCDNDGGPGAAPAALVGLDSKTGEIRWTTPRNQGRGFSTPRLLRAADGRTDLVLNGPLGAWGYDPETGKERWRSTRTDPREASKFGEPMPVDDGDRVFIASGRPGPFQILKRPGTGDITTSHVVHQGRRRGRDVASPIAWQGRVYSVDTRGVLSCLDLRSGKELFFGRIGNRALASPIALQGKLLFLLDDGVTVVLEPGPTLQVVRRNRLAGEPLDFGASPAVAGGRLFLRSQTHLYCIGKK